VLVRCGLLEEVAHGGHEARVGLVGERRAEVAAIVARGEIENAQQRAWIERS
jgi:hypothetical protein